MRGLRLILAAVFVILVSGCANKLKDIDVTSFRIVSITPDGLDSVNALVEIGISNPSVSFEIRDINATVKFKGEDMLYLSADQLIVDARSEKLYKLPLAGSFAEDFNPLILLQIPWNKADMSDITISLKAYVSLRGGLGKEIEYNELALDQILERI